MAKMAEIQNGPALPRGDGQRQIPELPEPEIEILGQPSPHVAAEMLRLGRWILIMVFFAVVPWLFLKGGEIGLRQLETRTNPGRFVSEFSGDLPMIMLSFWGGTMGSIIAYIYDRLP